MSATTGAYEPYYVPHSSRLPIWTALGSFITMAGLGYWLMQSAQGVEEPNRLFFLVGFLILAVTLFFWFRRVIIENHQGLPSVQMGRSYVWGMSWFIFSEVMFFAAFFGALFYVRTFAVPWLGGEGERGLAGDYLWPEFSPQWPPLANPDNAAIPGPRESMELHEFSLSLGWFRGLLAYLPFWNTVVLVSSSFTVHIAHQALKNQERKKLNIWMAVTVALGMLFLVLQAWEYVHAYQDLGLTLGSGIYGSTFFILTGFHGFHVTLGAFILLMILLRCLKGHFSPGNHFGFEAASWYWHFVDVVWLGLFIFVYVF